ERIMQRDVQTLELDLKALVDEATVGTCEKLRQRLHPLFDGEPETTALLQTVDLAPHDKRPGAEYLLFVAGVRHQLHEIAWPFGDLFHEQVGLGMIGHRVQIQMGEEDLLLPDWLSEDLHPCGMAQGR